MENLAIHLCGPTGTDLRPLIGGSDESSHESYGGAFMDASFIKEGI
jgi:hypothetical protein